jgi:hypothetical protein
VGASADGEIPSSNGAPRFAIQLASTCSRRLSSTAVTGRCSLRRTRRCTNRMNRDVPEGRQLAMLGVTLHVRALVLIHSTQNRDVTDIV